MSNNKGMEMAFNWVFSIVAGALIFLFLIYFAFQHTDLFGKRTNLLVREEFDNAFGGLESTDISTLIELEERVTLKFECVSGRMVFSVNEGDKREIPGKIIAAPRILSGKNFTISTDSLIKPFKITSFIYIQSDERRINAREDPLQKAYDYSEDDDCINDMISERLKLVKEAYKNKARYLNRQDCDYGTLIGRINNLNSVDDLNNVDDIIYLNENLIERGCPALF